MTASRAAQLSHRRKDVPALSALAVMPGKSSTASLLALNRS